MTAHSHDPAAHVDSPRPEPAAAGGTATTAARPRWLVPALVGGTVIGFLVLYGVLSTTAVLYGGLIGGMLLMHAGGHGGHGGHGGGAGHGGHGEQGGHDGHAGRGARGAENLRAHSSDTQGAGSGSEDELDDRASTEESGSETHDHDKRSWHGCH